MHLEKLLYLYLGLAKKQVITLPDDSRTKACKWIQKLESAPSQDEDEKKLQLHALKLLLLTLERKLLSGPFEDPPDEKNFTEYDWSGLELLDFSNMVVKKENDTCGSPNTSYGVSGNRRELVTYQDDPTLGQRCYYACSSEPIERWDNLQGGAIPSKAISIWQEHGEWDVLNQGESRSSVDVPRSGEVGEASEFGFNFRCDRSNYSNQATPPPCPPAPSPPRCEMMPDRPATPPRFGGAGAAQTYGPEQFGLTQQEAFRSPRGVFENQEFDQYPSPVQQAPPPQQQICPRSAGPRLSDEVRDSLETAMAFKPPCFDDHDAFKQRMCSRIQEIRDKMNQPPVQIEPEIEMEPDNYQYEPLTLDEPCDEFNDAQVEDDMQQLGILSAGEMDDEDMFGQEHVLDPTTIFKRPDEDLLTRNMVKIETSEMIGDTEREVTEELLEQEEVNVTPRPKFDENLLDVSEPSFRSPPPGFSPIRREERQLMAPRRLPTDYTDLPCEDLDEMSQPSFLMESPKTPSPRRRRAPPSPVGQIATPGTPRICPGRRSGSPGRRPMGGVCPRRRSAPPAMQAVCPMRRPPSPKRPATPERRSPGPCEPEFLQGFEATPPMRPLPLVDEWENLSDICEPEFAPEFPPSPPMRPMAQVDVEERLSDVCEPDFGPEFEPTPPRSPARQRTPTGRSPAQRTPDRRTPPPCSPQMEVEERLSDICAPEFESPPGGFSPLRREERHLMAPRRLPVDYTDLPCEDLDEMSQPSFLMESPKTPPPRPRAPPSPVGQIATPGTPRICPGRRSGSPGRRPMGGVCPRRRSAPAAMQAVCPMRRPPSPKRPATPERRSPGPCEPEFPPGFQPTPPMRPLPLVDEWENISDIGEPDFAPDFPPSPPMAPMPEEDAGAGPCDVYPSQQAPEYQPTPPRSSPARQRTPERVPSARRTPERRTPPPCSPQMEVEERLSDICAPEFESPPGGFSPLRREERHLMAPRRLPTDYTDLPCEDLDEMSQPSFLMESPRSPSPRRPRTPSSPAGRFATPGTPKICPGRRSASPGGRPRSGVCPARRSAPPAMQGVCPMRRPPSPKGPATPERRSPAAAPCEPDFPPGFQPTPPMRPLPFVDEWENLSDICEPEFAPEFPPSPPMRPMAQVDVEERLSDVCEPDFGPEFEPTPPRSPARQRTPIGRSPAQRTPQMEVEERLSDICAPEFESPPGGFSPLRREERHLMAPRRLPTDYTDLPCEDLDEMSQPSFLMESPKTPPPRPRAPPSPVGQIATPGTPRICPGRRSGSPGQRPMGGVCPRRRSAPAAMQAVCPMRRPPSPKRPATPERRSPGPCEPEFPPGFQPTPPMRPLPLVDEWENISDIGEPDFAPDFPPSPPMAPRPEEDAGAGPCDVCPQEQAPEFQRTPPRSPARQRTPERMPSARRTPERRTPPPCSPQMEVEERLSDICAPEFESPPGGFSPLRREERYLPPPRRLPTDYSDLPCEDLDEMSQPSFLMESPRTPSPRRARTPSGPDVRFATPGTPKICPGRRTASPARRPRSGVCPRRQSAPGAIQGGWQQPCPRTPPAPCEPDYPPGFQPTPPMRPLPFVDEWENLSDICEPEFAPEFPPSPPMRPMAQVDVEERLSDVCEPDFGPEFEPTPPRSPARQRTPTGGSPAQRTPDRRTPPPCSPQMEVEERLSDICAPEFESPPGGFSPLRREERHLMAPRRLPVDYTDLPCEDLDEMSQPSFLMESPKTPPPRPRAPPSPVGQIATPGTPRICPGRRSGSPGRQMGGVCPRRRSAPAAMQAVCPMRRPPSPKRPPTPERRSPAPCEPEFPPGFQPTPPMRPLPLVAEWENISDVCTPDFAASPPMVEMDVAQMMSEFEEPNYGEQFNLNFEPEYPLSFAPMPPPCYEETPRAARARDMPPPCRQLPMVDVDENLDDIGEIDFAPEFEDSPIRTPELRPMPQVDIEERLSDICEPEFAPSFGEDELVDQEEVVRTPPRSPRDQGPQRVAYPQQDVCPADRSGDFRKAFADMPYYAPFEKQIAPDPSPIPRKAFQSRLRKPGTFGQALGAGVCRMQGSAAPSKIRPPCPRTPGAGLQAAPQAQPCPQLQTAPGAQARSRLQYPPSRLSQICPPSQYQGQPQSRIQFRPQAQPQAAPQQQRPPSPCPQPSPQQQRQPSPCPQPCPQPSPQQQRQPSPCPHVSPQQQRQPSPCPHVSPQQQRQPSPCPHVSPQQQRQPSPCPQRSPQQQRQPSPCPHVSPQQQRQPSPCPHVSPQQQRQPSPCPHVSPQQQRQPSPCPHVSPQQQRQPSPCPQHRQPSPCPQPSPQPQRQPSPCPQPCPQPSPQQQRQPSPCPHVSPPQQRQPSPCPHVSPQQQRQPSPCPQVSPQQQRQPSPCPQPCPQPSPQQQRQPSPCPQEQRQPSPCARPSPQQQRPPSPGPPPCPAPCPAPGSSRLVCPPSRLQPPGRLSLPASRIPPLQMGGGQPSRLPPCPAATPQSRIPPPGSVPRMATGSMSRLPVCPGTQSRLQPPTSRLQAPCPASQSRLQPPQSRLQQPCPAPQMASGSTSRLPPCPVSRIPPLQMGGAPSRIGPPTTTPGRSSRIPPPPTSTGPSSRIPLPPPSTCPASRPAPTTTPGSRLRPPTQRSQLPQPTASYTGMPTARSQSSIQCPPSASQMNVQGQDRLLKKSTVKFQLTKSTFTKDKGGRPK